MESKKKVPGRGKRRATPRPTAGAKPKRLEDRKPKDGRIRILIEPATVLQLIELQPAYGWPGGDEIVRMIIEEAWKEHRGIK